MKKSSFLLFVGLMCIMSLLSCSSSSNDEGDKTPANPLIGTWYTEGEEKGQATYTETTYNADLTCTLRDYKSDRTTIKESDSGKYQVNGNKLTIFGIANLIARGLRPFL